MKKILLVEDNAEMRENTAEILELSNYEVVTAANGKEGIEAAKKEYPDLIICDIMMPELDGYGVLRVLSKLPNTANIPFIFLTAKTEKEDFRKGMRMGADDYLTKPFDAKELKIRMQNLIKQRARLQKKYQGQLKIRPKQITDASGQLFYCVEFITQIAFYFGHDLF